MSWSSLELSGPAEHPLADDRAAELEEGRVQLGETLVASSQPAQVVQPGEGPLHHPAL